jgi:glycosyltransferase involved in cell wall biosynthesis
MSDSVSLVYIINSLDIGGAEIGMCRILGGLDGYDATIVALSGQSNALGPRIPADVDVIDLSLTGTPSVSALRSFVRAVRGADVIVGSLFHSALLARLAGILNPSATVATWQHTSRFESDRRRNIFYYTTDLSDVVLADSETVAEMLVDDLGLDDSTVRTVPIAGIQLEEYTPVTHEGTTDIRVGTVGRIAPVKNYLAVLDVAERTQDAGLSFHIAGDGDLYDDLQADIERRQLHNVELLGHVDDVPSFLATLDIYFQPSLWEGLCITVLEAMAAGLPVVGSDVGGIGRNVEPDVSGSLYEPSDVDGFADGIERLAADPQRRARFGQRGQAIVEQSFTQAVLVEAFEKAIRD